ncbi:putative bifunctional diguanylate cyclase/phosphodiesterase [Actinoplanes sp. NPDC049265]|uniref:putative bifunctional diguanylate cyclase/phosphodiesterase n=1 Tax=Actinoplanes sp. NPDC049265 TaxID=3363902 RepID=UPI003715B23E
MTTARLGTARMLPVTLALVAVLVAAGRFAVPAGDARRVYHVVVQLLVAAAAGAVCLWIAGRREDAGRRWRQLAGIGLLGWAAVRLWWLIRAFADPDGMGRLHPGDVGFLVLPVLLGAGLLVGAAALPRPVPLPGRRDLIILVIDCVLIAGSLIAPVWSLVPVRVFEQGGRTPAVFALAVAYPIADLILLVMAVLLLLMRQGGGAIRRQLLLIAAALAAFGVSDTLRLLNLGADGLNTAAAAGYLLGPALLALAALAPGAAVGDLSVAHRERDWLHLLLPYVPVVATGVVIAVRTGTGGRLTTFEAYLGWLGLGLVVARQMFTIVDNLVLLSRVTEGQRRMRHQAYHDPLTGLANRALFRERLDAVLDARSESGRPVALLFADLDDFKLINDSFGHAMGDRLLRAIGERLLGVVPSGDLVARLGGDEFAVVLDHRAADAELIGHRMLAVLREPFQIDGHTIGVGASIGLVQPEPHDRDLTADTLLRRADAAMYAGKRRGKGTMARYSGGADGGPNADLPHQLAQALAGDPAAAGFEVYYQPIVRFTDGATVAVEALARWNDPVAGLVDPDVFVTVAERTGLVGAIDDFVLDRACADAAVLANIFGRPIDVHVNVSAARLCQEGLESAVLGALDRHAVRPSRLVVEITETKRIPDLQRAIEVATRLREAGVRLALDDFGSGYNALAQLHSLPVDIVKLDATLTDVDVSPERAEALCRSVLAICDSLGLTVVAEGIETAPRAQAMAALGCPLGQGYLFGQPVPLGKPVIPSQNRQAAARPV